MKKCLLAAIALVLGLSGVASALTYIDTPEGRRPVEGGEWFVSGGVAQDYLWPDMLERRATDSFVSIEYYLTPQLSLQGYSSWMSSEGTTQARPVFRINLDSNLTENLELRLDYDWSESSGRQRQSVMATLRYQHLNH